MRSPVACIVVVIAGGLVATLAQADAPAETRSVQLVYARGAGAEQCPDEEELRDAVAGRLGYDPFDATAKSKVSARIFKDGKTLRATVDVIDATGAITGTRELSSTKNDCVELASAMTLTISMVVDPLGKGPPPPPPPTIVAPPPATSSSPPPPPAPTVVPVVIAPPPPVVDTSSARAAETRPRLRLGLGGQGALGFAPRSSFGATAAVGLDLGVFSLDLEGRRDAPTTAAVGRGSITTAVSLASIVPCLHEGVAVACAVASLGALQARGGGVDVTSAQSAAFFGVGVRGGVELPISKAFSLFARLEVLAPLIRTSIHLDGDEVWSAPTLSGSLGLGALAFF